MKCFCSTLLLLLAGTHLVEANIPGTTSTNNGYNTELGTDPVCWTSRSTSLLKSMSVTDILITPFPNEVVKDFTLLGETMLLLECPSGNDLKVFAPPEFGTAPHHKDGIHPRTKQWYNYTIQFTINQRELEGNTIISDDSPTIVAVQVSSAC